VLEYTGDSGRFAEGSCTASKELSYLYNCNIVHHKCKIISGMYLWSDKQVYQYLSNSQKPSAVTDREPYSHTHESRSGASLLPAPSKLLILESHSSRRGCKSIYSIPLHTCLACLTGDQVLGSCGPTIRCMGTRMRGERYNSRSRVIPII